jgi:hypothetical protein
MHIMHLPPLQRIFCIIFSGQELTTLIVTLFCFSSYIWSCISLVQKNSTPHRKKLSPFLFRFVALSVTMSNNNQKHNKHVHSYTYRKTERESGTHVGIYIELSSPSCSSDSTEDQQPSAPLLL